MIFVDSPEQLGVWLNEVKIVFNFVPHLLLALFVKAVGILLEEVVYFFDEGLVVKSRLLFFVLDAGYDLHALFMKCFEVIAYL